MITAVGQTMSNTVRPIDDDRVDMDTVHFIYYGSFSVICVFSK